MRIGGQRRRPQDGAPMRPTDHSPHPRWLLASLLLATLGVAGCKKHLSDKERAAWADYDANCRTRYGMEPKTDDFNDFEVEAYAQDDRDLIAAVRAHVVVCGTQR
jgi:hypothetical protein